MPFLVFTGEQEVRITDMSIMNWINKRKKRGQRLMALLAAVMLIPAGLPLSAAASPQEPVQYTTALPAASGQTSRSWFSSAKSSTTTVLIYMIGSNLESESAAGTADLVEMINANPSSSVNIIVETGGSKRWQNKVISANTLERYRVGSGGLARLEQLPVKSMADPDTLADFISWGVAEYPADRYELILWDHGGGTVSGYGYDELYPNGMLTISGIQKALEKGGCHFDIIAFDACLMATLEVAQMLSEYADYMIASEELEPGAGYYYTGWVSLLSRNPSVDPVTLGKKLIDDFASVYSNSRKVAYTLSMIDLSKIGAVNDALGKFMDNSILLLDNKAFSNLSMARSEARDFGNGKYEQIDIADYVSRVEGLDSRAVSAAVSDCVSYQRTNLKGANGLAMYYPYKYLGAYDAVWNDLNIAGVAENYGSYFDKFASIMTGGVVTGHSNPYVQEPEEEEQWEAGSFEWYDGGQVEEYASYYEQNSFQMPQVKEKDGHYILPLTEKNWELLTYIEQWVYMDDGEGFVDLGADNYYQVDEENNLIVDYDYMWVALNDQIVPFYTEVENYDDPDDWYTYGYVTAELNGRDAIEIVLQWDSAEPDGYVCGWRYARKGLGTPAAKGLFDFKKNDVIKYICNYYNYDGSFDAQYYWSDPVRIGDGGIQDLKVSYKDIGKVNTLISYLLVDIYQNAYQTPEVELSF